MFDATTILAYKGKNKAVIGGDGQVTFGQTVLKNNATKIRTLHNGEVLADLPVLLQTHLTFLICSKSI